MPRPSRIALVLASPKGEYTGRYEWAKRLYARGFDVTLILPQGEEEFVCRMREEAPSLGILRYHLDRAGIRPREQLRSIRDLRRHLLDGSFELIHSFGHKPNILAAIAAPNVRGTHVVSQVTGLGYLFSRERPSVLDHVLKLGVRMAYRVVARRADQIVAQNPEDARLFDFLPSNKVHLIQGCGVDTASFTKDLVPSTRKVQIQHELDIQGRIVVTFVGRLLRDKGVAELIQAAVQVKEILPQALFLLVGDVDYGNRAALTSEELAFADHREELRVLGRRSDIREILSVTDIFINPSYREGLPRTHLEAMAMSLPVVACDVPGSRETVVHGVTGLLVSPRDADSLAHAIRRLAADPELRTRMGNAGRHLVETRFTTEHIMDQIVDLYEDVLSSHRVGGNAS